MLQNSSHSPSILHRALTEELPALSALLLAACLLLPPCWLCCPSLYQLRALDTHSNVSAAHDIFFGGRGPASGTWETARCRS